VVHPQRRVRGRRRSVDSRAREFTEETGFAVDGDFIPLAPIKQPSGKVVYTWIVPGNYDAALVRSNTFTLKGREYPRWIAPPGLI